MNDIPENKQKRLMSLNQDVLAVSPTSTAAHRAVSPSHPNAAEQDEQGAGAVSVARRGRGLAAVLGVLVVVLLIALGVVVTMTMTMQRQLDEVQQQLRGAVSVDLTPIEARLNRFEQLLTPLEERISALESQPVVIQSDSGARTDVASQAAVAQVNARVRKMDIEMARLQEELAAARAELTALASRQQRNEGQLATLSGLPARLDSLAGQASGGNDQTRLAEVEARLERAGNDIRSLYRMIEMGR